MGRRHVLNSRVFVNKILFGVFYLLYLGFEGKKKVPFSKSVCVTCLCICCVSETPGCMLTRNMGFCSDCAKTLLEN